MTMEAEARAIQPRAEGHPEPPATERGKELTDVPLGPPEGEGPADTLASRTGREGIPVLSHAVSDTL